MLLINKLKNQCLISMNHDYLLHQEKQKLVHYNCNIPISAA